MTQPGQDQEALPLSKTRRKQAMAELQALGEELVALSADRVKKIDIPEQLGVDGRGSFYEETGAFRDMVVTHLAQILGFVAMEQPASLDAGALRDAKAALFQDLDFGQQMLDVQHYAVADVALDASPHDAAGDQVQSGLHTVDNQCVAGVVAALEAHDASCRFRQPVNQLALALVTPLGADHDHVAPRDGGAAAAFHHLRVSI